MMRQSIRKRAIYQSIHTNTSFRICNFNLYTILGIDNKFVVT